MEWACPHRPRRLHQRLQGQRECRAVNQTWQGWQSAGEDTASKIAAPGLDVADSRARGRRATGAVSAPALPATSATVTSIKIIVLTTLRGELSCRGKLNPRLPDIE